jgi:uncharacterized protein (DUF433 family)
MTRIVSDPTIMSGDWTIEGTRILAVTIAEYLHAGRSDDEIRDDFPTLPDGAIEAVRRWMTGIDRDLNRELIRNSAHCLICHSDIESERGHDFRTCRCGNVSVDGGSGYGSYARRAYVISGDPGLTWVDTSIFAGDQE